MKECRVCRSPISEGEQFCHTCGTRLPFNPDVENPKRDPANEELNNSDSSSSLITDEMLISTTSILYGHSIMKYMEPVFGISLYSNIPKDDIQNDEAKMECIAKSNRLALNRMIEHGKSLGANAIIGVTMQQTTYNGSMVISFLGTAVTIIPKETSETIISVNQDNVLGGKESYPIATPDNQKGEVVDNQPKEEFLRKIINIDNIFEIWHLWKEYSLEEEYPEVDTLLSKRKCESQSFGQLSSIQIKKLKNDLNRLLSNNKEYENTDDDSSPEDEFFHAVEEVESVSDIWDLWKELDLFIKYPEANELLSQELRKERTFGTLTKTQINKLIRTLNSIISM